MAASPYSLLSVVDHFDIEVLKGFGNDKVFFLPHGVSSALANEPAEEKEYDIVFIGSCYDYLSLRDHWRGELKPDVTTILEIAVEIFLNDHATSLQSALAEAVNQCGTFPKNLDFMQIFRYLDIYTRGFDRIQLIRSLKDNEVHIFGGSCEGDLYPLRGWKDYMGDRPNIHIHDPLNYEEVFECFKKEQNFIEQQSFFQKWIP